MDLGMQAGRPSGEGLIGRGIILIPAHAGVGEPSH